VDQYCVVLCGLQAGAPDETSAWQPVATALKLDHAEFERRVVAALPRIVRRELDQATAERIARVLQAMHVDARVLPDDPQLAYIERAGASCGPLPQSSLDDFIQPGESFRLRGSTTWQPWPGPVDHEPVMTADADDIDDPSSSPAFRDEPVDAVATPDTSHDAGDAAPDEPSIDADEPPEPAQNPPPSAASDEVSDATWDAAPLDTDARPHGAMPPPLDTAQAESAPAPREDGEVTEATTNTPEDAEVIEPATDTPESAHDDDLVNPAEETTAATSPDAAAAPTPEVVETRPPARSGRGRLVVLLVLIALAIWAYRHWTADTRTDGSPAAPAVIQPANTAAGEPATPAPVMPADNATSATAPAAAVTPATSSAAPAGTDAVPAAATSTPAPAASAPGAATATSTPAAAETTTIPSVPASTPAPATSANTPAAIPAR
jgi:S-DNA-T family DNA segregation ATPase FtsK/SpoIIIE